MNQQLTLLNLNDSATKASKRPLKTKRKTTKVNNESEAWWRLSEQERNQGLAGVRAIRAILQNIDTQSDMTWAKAS